MKKIFIGIMILFPALCFAQEITIIGSVPQTGSQGLYRIQVGAYTEAVNAERALNSLRDAGLNPIYENHWGVQRVVLVNVRANNFTHVLDTIRDTGFYEVWIREEIPTSLYRVQVGAFREAANAERAFNTLQNAGLNPVYENHAGLQRVALPGVSANDLPHLLSALGAIGFHDNWVREEPAASILSIVVHGGAVSEITPSGNIAPLAVVQSIPSFIGSEIGYYQVNAPIVFFFNEQLYLGSLDGSIEVTIGETPIHGTVIINESATGDAVLTFTPNDPLPVGEEFTIVVRSELQDGSGNRMQNDFRLSFRTTPGSEIAFDRDNFGFEAGDYGVVFTGDGAIAAAIGPLVPFEGNYYAVISTGTRIVSGTGAAMGRTMSQIFLGPIMEPFSSLTFYYDFISAEFNEYVNSRFDDNARIYIRGPRGVHTEKITSVNIIGFDNARFSNFPRMPDDGDSYAGHTGWVRHHIENIDVGTPAYIIFTVTDVGDDIFSSIFAIDALELE